MKSSLIWIVLGGAILFFGGTADAWGGLFNRFSPEMLANLGYGNHGGGYHPFLQNDIFAQEEEAANEDDPCYERRCNSNEDCCPAQVCYNPRGEGGRCFFEYGRKLGEFCRWDSDCEAGLTCDSIGPNGGTVCSAPTAPARQYSEDCVASYQCDISRGLCCQLQRRHRQAPRRVCSYFKDPLTCIGTVAVNQIKHEVQHTAGEKRISSIWPKHGLNGLNQI